MIITITRRQLATLVLTVSMLGLAACSGGGGGGGSGGDTGGGGGGGLPANPAGTLQFDAAAYTVDEYGNSITLTVNREGGSTGAVSVDYATADDSATAGEDYGATSGTLSWADGETAPKTIVVPVMADSLYEVSETLTLTLSNATEASLGSRDIATITIADKALTTTSTYYFRGDNGVDGDELWKTDGTPQGTVMVKNINTNTGAGSLAQGFTVAGTNTYFVANNGINGRELWKTDGTEGGTQMVRDILPTGDGLSRDSLVPWGSSVYFAAADPTYGTELWRSDGTPGGTVRLSNINANTSYNGGSSYPVNFAIYNNRLYFRANNGSASGTELWVHDPSTGGTALVKDLNTNASLSSGNGYPQSLTPYANRLFFVAYDSLLGQELWSSYGAASNTAVHTDIRPNGNSGPRILTPTSIGLFLNANDGSTGSELYRVPTGGGAAALVRDINVGAGNSIYYAQTPSGIAYCETNITEMGGRVYFFAYHPTYGFELWSTAGTSNTTQIVKDVNPGTAHGCDRNTEVVAIGNTLYFTAQSGSDIELWKSNGTVSGTVLVKNINASGSSAPRDLAVVDGVLYFSANNGVNGYELWRSDGTDQGTVMIKDINIGSGSGRP